MTFEQIQSRLRKFLWTYESCVVLATLAGGLYVALGQGGSLGLALPLGLVASAEAMRVPTAAILPRLAGFGRTLGMIALVAISAISFEGLIFLFEAVLLNRMTNVIEAQRVVDVASEELKQAQSDRAKAQKAIDAASAEADSVTALLKAKEEHPPEQPALANKCGRAVCNIDRQARIDFARAQKDHLAELKSLRLQRRDAAASVSNLSSAVDAVDVKAPEQALFSAERKLEDLKTTSPIHRLAASLVGVTPKTLRSLRPSMWSAGS